MQSHTRSKRKTIGEKIFHLPARIGQIASRVYTCYRSVHFFAFTRGKPFWHENDGKTELYMIEEDPFAYTSVHDTFLTKRAKKDEKNRQKPYKLIFRTCCVHNTANLTRYLCFSCNVAPGTCVKCIKNDLKL
jgi:hypothetical protein